MVDEREKGQPGLKESGMCEHGNFPGNCDACKQSTEDQPEEPDSENQEDESSVAEAREKYMELQKKYEDVRERMDAALNRRHENDARMEANMGKPGEEFQAIELERKEIAQLEADIQIEERGLRAELDKALEEWDEALDDRML